jgi:uncharacterized DUF497 family protein
MFEYDPEKSRSNEEKHGIDFKEAQLLWVDERHIELPSREPREERYLVIGMIGGKMWTAIVTYRAECIRIISVRRARKKEAEIYDS